MGNPDGKQPAATSDTPQSDAANKPGEGQTQVDWEKRYKDTQSAFTKKSQELIQTKAELEALKTQGTTPLQLDKSVVEELEDLKITNPEAWRVRLNQIEAEHNAKINATVTAKVQELTVSEQRVAELLDFQASHPGFILNDDDVPPRIAKRLTSGQIDFKTFLQEVHDFVSAPKAFGDGNKVTGQPNINTVGGDANPAQHSVYTELSKSYKKEVY